LEVSTKHPRVNGFKKIQTLDILGRIMFNSTVQHLKSCLGPQKVLRRWLRKQQIFGYRLLRRNHRLRSLFAEILSSLTGGKAAPTRLLVSISRGCRCLLCGRNHALLHSTANAIKNLVGKKTYLVRHFNRYVRFGYSPCARIGGRRNSFYSVRFSYLRHSFYRWSNLKGLVAAAWIATDDSSESSRAWSGTCLRQWSMDLSVSIDPSRRGYDKTLHPAIDLAIIHASKNSRIFYIWR